MYKVGDHFLPEFGGTVTVLWVWHPKCPGFVQVIKTQHF